MWSEDNREHDDEHRASTSSEVMVMDERITAAAIHNVPNVSNLNISKSSRVHIGPKLVSVTQNINNVEMVKEVSLPRYLWNVIKNTTKAEKLSCAAALLALILCMTLIIYFTVIAKKSSVDVEDTAPHEWNITKEMWLAQPRNYTIFTTEYEPLKLVIIQHSVSPECHTFILCAAELRNIQNYYLTTLDWDIPYNFIIGNDGRVYEGRGWTVSGAHTINYNRCSVGIGFIGDYRENVGTVHSRVTQAQLTRMQMLLDYGVEMGHLRPDYFIVGAKDLTITESPGSNLYEAIRLLPRYDREQRYRNMSCDQIHGRSPTTTIATTAVRN